MNRPRRGPEAPGQLIDRPVGPTAQEVQQIVLSIFDRDGRRLAPITDSSCQ